MLKRSGRILIFTCVTQIFFVVIVFQSEAKDLTDVLGQGFNFQAATGLTIADPQFGSIGDFSDAAKALGPAFSAAVAQEVTQDFPLSSVAPAFIYRHNPTVDIFERLTGVPGPLFSERALTLGKGRWDIGVGYSFIDYDDVNGQPLNNLKSLGLITEIPIQGDVEVGSLPTGEKLIEIPYVLSQIRTRIDLKANLFVPTVRYGITDNWDVSLALPVVNTSLRVSNEAVRTVDIAARIALGGEKGFQIVDLAGNEIDPNLSPEEFDRQLFRFVKSRRPPLLLSRASGNATGIGDVVLRTKYHFWQNGLGGGAAGLNLQLPTGKARDFHGTGQTHLQALLYFSQVLRERFEPHLNLGIDFNADDVNRSSFLYTVGGTLRIGEKLGVVIDFLGRHEFGGISVHFASEDKIKGGILDKPSGSCRADQPCFVAREVEFSAIPIRIKRNDIANFSFGLRYALGTGGSIFFGGVIPLNTDGFRADFIPSGGIEYTF